MYTLNVIYFDDLDKNELLYSFDSLKDIFDYIKNYIEEEDIFEFRIYRQ